VLFNGVVVVCAHVLLARGVVAANGGAGGGRRPAAPGSGAVRVNRLAAADDSAVSAFSARAL
jgi:hypothetical protein